MLRFHAFILGHRSAVALATVLLVAAGLAAWRDLPIDAFPDATNRQVMILTEAEGLGPLDVEQQVTFPIESVMGGLPHVRQVRSLSKTALSQVVVIFEDHVDTYFARQLVFERLQTAREQLPPGVEPEMGPISTGLGEVFQYTLRSDRHDPTELRTFQDWLVAPRLRAIPGVNEVNSLGGRVRQVEVTVDPDRLLKYDLTLPEVIAAVAASNANAGGGFLTKAWEQENLRTLGLLAAPQELRQVVLRARDGTPVTLAEVADVRESSATRFGAATRDGEGETVAGAVIMLAGENSQAVVERVKAALPAIEQALPEGVTIDVFYDRTDLVRRVIGTVAGALLQGGLLVVLVLFLLAGNARAALVAAASLPLVALFVFVLMGAAGVTANLMSLGGLAIAIGMVVDGTIVVTENVARRLREGREGAAEAGTGGASGHGGAPRDGALSLHAAAAAEVGRPIVFSILIVVLVMLPLFTLEGVEGRMFEPLALTMIFAMLGALLVSQTIVPAALSRVLRDGARLGEPRLVRRAREAYLRLLAAALRRRGLTIGAAAVLFLAALALSTRLGTEFLPPLEEGAIAINAVRLPNAGLEGSVSSATFLEKEILALPEVATVVSKTGRAEISEDPMGPEQTDFLIMLKRGGRSRQEVVAELEERLGRVPGLRLAFSQPIALRVNELISGVKSDVAVEIFGPDLELLKARADEAAALLRGIAGAADVGVEQVAGFTTLEIVPDRAALARHQLSVGDLNELVRNAVGGTVATTLVDGQVRVPVQVRYREDARGDVPALERLLLSAPGGARVPLGQVATIRRVEGPAQISREQGMRRVMIEVNVRGRDVGGFVREAQATLAPLVASLPAGHWVEYGGTFESQQRAMNRLAVVVPVSILLILVMLVSALGAIRPAALVLTALPLALVGGVGAMLLLGQRLNVPSTVGFIALFGTAVQNGTVLVSFIEQLRREGAPLREAVLAGCSLRFRALLMTAATTVLGLAPMLWATGAGAEIQRPLAVVVIGGLLTATALTLIVLPVLYDWAGGSSGSAGAAGAMGAAGAAGAGTRGGS